MRGLSVFVVGLIGCVLVVCLSLGIDTGFASGNEKMGCPCRKCRSR